MFERSDFRDLVLRDAASIQGRQETDTVDIIDEIRFCISGGAVFEQQATAQEWNHMADKLPEQERMLAVVDKLLQELNLDV